MSNNAEPLLAFVHARLPTQPDGSPKLGEEQSDVVHDFLAFLAQAMADLYSHKKAEVGGFLGWLEGYVGVQVEELMNKTKVQEYYCLEGGWDAFAGVLDQNQHRIRQRKDVDVTRREPREVIRQEYEASMERLRPLLRKIEFTDWLIDQIVYRLYGLTEDEVAIVEGQA